MYQARGVQKSDARWIAPGRLVTIRGFDVPGGMVYVGSFMPADPTGGWAAATPSPCLIDPSLKAASRRPAPAADLGYWPSYSDISAECRLRYLHWLSGGKRDPDIPIGYVFLHFYGIERRLLVDGPSPEETTLLVAEIGRLREVYGANASFSRYGESLVQVVEAQRLLESENGLAAWCPDLNVSSREKAFLLKLKIAHQVIAGEPLDFGLALAGMLTLNLQNGSIRQGIGITRAKPEFIELARRRFAKKFPDGFRLRDRKDTRLSLGYRPASRHLEFHLAINGGAGRLPDPEWLTWTKMADLCAKAAEDLVPYAKLVGKTRAKAGSVEAALLLPPELAGTESAGTTAAFGSWLANLPRPVAQIRLAELGQWCFGDDSESLGAKRLREISAILDRLGYGMEPDATHGMVDVRPARDILVFSVADPSGATTRPGTAFQHAALVAAAMASVVASSRTPQDGGVRTVSDLVERLHLSVPEAVRLAARFRLMRGQPLPPSRLKKMATAIPPGEREAVARLAAAVASGQTIDPAAVAAIERFYDVLGIDRRSLYDVLHRGAAVAAPRAVQPVVVEQRDVRSGTHRIPSPPVETPTRQSGEAVIDMARVGSILRETREVSEVLAPIYQDDDPAEVTSPRTAQSAVDEGRFAGLTTEHACLLSALCGQERWPRTDFEVEARRLGLMPDGAAETINEWAYDALGGDLIEDGDPMIVNVALLPPAPGEGL